ncbi:hypothetical protein DEALK_11540 [Dehalogenimonas alkenigignens]|jgi:hypothetical protein|uniref:Uncharacterized protein n=1 Tax=Dehalogenimonas alkenigignens TaxID=1217799 RepID=A0A0W0GIC3_9CHLR|nr:hypothetical protein [Dehalogenimonas alkenigignens]KTB48308.1 hypothetical protein DEALK_11540 [Dehalogenimonas alkenigignens]
MKNIKLWTLISAGLAVVAVGGGFMAQGEEGTMVQIHALIGVVTLAATVIAAYIGAKST